jgi:hypothetical protein
MKSIKHALFLAVLTASISSCSIKPRQAEMISNKTYFNTHTDTSYHKLGSKEVRIIKLKPANLTIVCQ